MRYEIFRSHEQHKQEERVAQDQYVDSFSISTKTLEGINVLEIIGEVDIANVSLVAKALSNIAVSGKGPLILDAQHLSYVDSAGIQTILSAHKNLLTKGRKLVIVGCHGVFYRLMQIAMLENCFQMFSTVEEAISMLNLV